MLHTVDRDTGIAEAQGTRTSPHGLAHSIRLGAKLFSHSFPSLHLILLHNQICNISLRLFFIYFPLN